MTNKLALKGTFLEKMSDEEIFKLADDAYFGVIAKESTLFNPLAKIPSSVGKNIAEYFAYLMQMPDYFYFIVKYIFGMNTIPSQAMLLKELYTHKFPILLGSRGFAKSSSIAMYLLIRMMTIPGRKCVITAAGFRQAKLVFDYMENIWKTSPILRNMYSGKHNGPVHGTDVWTFRLGDSITYALPVGPDGSKIRGFRANDLVADEFACLDKNSLVETDHGLIRVSDFNNGYNILTGDSNIIENPTKFIKTPLCDVYQITFKNGYTIKCSSIHKLKTNNGWKSTLELKAGDFVERSNPNMIFGNYPLDEKMAWLMGILVSEGCVTHKSRISITITDKSISDRLVHEYGFKVKEREAYVNYRGWKCKKSYVLYTYNKLLRNKLFNLGIDYVTAHDKKIPHSILQSPKNVIQSFLSGLFLGDGSAFLWKDRDIDNNLGLAYYSVSERLCRDVQVLMYKLGYDGYINKRKSTISNKYQWFVRWNNNTAINACKFLNVHKFEDAFNNCFIRSNPSNICCYKGKYKVQISVLGKKIEKTFKDIEDAEKFIDYIKNDIQYQKITKIEKLDYQDHLYDYYLPQSHSFYADGFRNHNSMNRQVFEEVMSGFLTVSSNPIQKVRDVAKEKFLRAIKYKKKNKEFENIEMVDSSDNQLILSGTAYYKFNHFYEYFSKWREIIYTKGDHQKIKNIMGEDYNPEKFNWKNYSVVRVPIELVAEGFMDDDQIARIKASTSKDVYLREYSCCFNDDSDGFYRRSLINSCTAGFAGNSPIIKNKEEVIFSPMLYGDLNKTYVYGVDPAYEGDNFAIVIIELDKGFRKVVHVWTTQSSDHKLRLKQRVITENDYYHYCARKIRNLMKRFPCAAIGIDAQGGGRAIIEAFRDESKLEEGEMVLLPVVDTSRPPVDTDMMAGHHIIHVINFTNDFTSEANHSLKKDMEDKNIIFPFNDSISHSIADFYDNSLGENKELFDTLEDCLFEIEELKKELTQIVLSETSTGKQKFDTPEVKTGINRKGRLHKDRYSALLLANQIARSAKFMTPAFINPDVMNLSGFDQIRNRGKLFYGHSSLVDKLQELYE